MQLRTSGAEIVLAVQDDGKGFDPGEVKGKGRLGLVSMEERARLLNGSFLLRSELGKGTSVEVSIPLNNVSQKTEIPAS